MLDELRKKSAHSKESYAFWGAFLVTGLIATVWLASLPVRLSEVDVVLESEGTAQTAGAFSQFFDEIKEDAGAIWNGGEGSTPISGEQATSSELFQEATPSSGSVVASTSVNTSGVLIATSSRATSTPSRTVQIATSSQSNR